MPDKKRIGLIVDNPLRDIDGAVLLAWQLAVRGAECFLIPMYAQGFDVPVLNLDVVVANYARKNNLDLLKAYKKSGIRVVVLDTEGAISRSAEFYARLVASSKCRDFVDKYFVWGKAQRDAFIKEEAMPADRVVVTGCPRYDFCAPQWRGALASTGTNRGYILINTNFPVVNPRFSSSTDKEVGIWKRVGYDASLASDMARDARQAFRTVLDVCDRLAKDFPSTQFVLRPHPFEKLSAYQDLEKNSNFKTRQNGTVLSWLNEASLLIHQNCSTAIEATMLGKNPVSLEWFNTPALSMPSPKLVSHPVGSYEELRIIVSQALSGEAFSVDKEVQRQRDRILQEEYAGANGSSASCAATEIMSLCDESWKAPDASIHMSWRGRAMAFIRHIAGYKNFQRFRSLFQSKAAESLVAKAFSREQVAEILLRISNVMHQPAKVFSAIASFDDYKKGSPSRLISGSIVRISTLRE